MVRLHPVSAQVSFTETRWPSGGRAPFAAVAVDLNGDRRPDLAVTNAGSERLAFLLAADDRSYQLREGPRVGEVARGLAAADLNADGTADLVIASASTNSVVVFLGDGKGAGSVTSFPAGLAPFQVAVADLNGDGNVDIAVANESNIDALKGKGQLSVLHGDGRGRFSPGPTLTGGTHPADVKVADLDRDGRMDIAAVNWESRDVSLFLGAAGGGFGRARTIPYRGGPAYALALADLDGDRRPDLVVGDATGLVRIFENQGKRFAAAPPLGAGRGLRSLAVADLDGDGRDDLATANTAEDTVTILLAKPAGGFAPPYQVAVGKRPRTVTATDLNGDGKTDLVVTNGGSDDVSVLINSGTAGPSQKATARPGGEP